MKTILLATTALLFAFAGTASASTITELDSDTGASKAQVIPLAKKGSDDGAGHDSGDDKGGDRNRGSDDSSNDDNDDNDDSGSGRSKPRVPGGSGCDDAGDVAEHASCGG